MKKGEIEDYLYDINVSLESISTSLAIIAMGQQQANIPRFLDTNTLLNVTENMRDIVRKEIK